MLTPNTLMKIAPSITSGLSVLYCPFINSAMDEFEINTRLRQAAFIAQIAHETGGLRYMREIWGPTEAQLSYEGRQSLGNIRTGDGKRYRGRGAIQLTGRTNYQKYGDLLGLDLINDPELACTKEVAFRIAGCFWKTHGLNELADTELFKSITKRINGGINGYNDRLAYYNRAREVL